jgi:mono/diheme cytochrome c family protein
VSAGLKAIALALAALMMTLAVACSSSETETLQFPVASSPELVQTGAEIYAANCVTCHGDSTGRDRQFNAPTHNSEGHTWHHPDRLLYQWVLDGPPLKTVMPAFRGQLSDEEVLAVIAYIKTFWTDEIVQYQNEGSIQYEEQVREFGQ